MRPAAERPTRREQPGSHQASGADDAPGCRFQRSFKRTPTSARRASCAPGRGGAGDPRFKYIDFNRRGYMLLDVTAQRAVCEWWCVDTVAGISNIETCGVAFEVQHGSNRPQPSAMTTPRADAPPLAP